jgi:hypothetical protein
MHRAVAAMVAVGDRLMFVFGDPRLLEGYAAPDGRVAPHDPVIELIKRGQAEGVFDPEVSPKLDSARPLGSCLSRVRGRR